eukprot:11356-Amphidinium_carterae.1
MEQSGVDQWFSSLFVPKLLLRPERDWYTSFSSLLESKVMQKSGVRGEINTVHAKTACKELAQLI